MKKVFWKNNLSSYFQTSEEKFYFEICKNGSSKYYEKLSPINSLYITSLISQKIDFIDDYSKSGLDIQDISNKILSINPSIKINPFIRKAIIIKSNSSQNKDLYRNVSKEFNKINFLDSIRSIYPSDLKNLKQCFLSK